MGFRKFLARLPLKFPFSLAPKGETESGPANEKWKKSNFRTFIASLTALWMNLDDVVARTADRQAPLLLVRANALRQITPVPLAVQSIVRMQTMLECVAVAKAQHIVSRWRVVRRRVVVLLAAVAMIALVA